MYTSPFQSRSLTYLWLSLGILLFSSLYLLVVGSVFLDCQETGVYIQYDIVFINILINLTVNLTCLQSCPINHNPLLKCVGLSNSMISEHSL